MSRARAKRKQPGRARFEFVDVATGEPVEPAPPDRVESDGAAPTGRLVADVEGTTIDVDEEDIIGRGEGEHPRERSYEFDEEPYRERAKAKAAKERRARARTRGPTKPRAIRATFDSSAEAARQFYDANALYFDNVRDPGDGLRDWMDGIEIGRGKSSRRLWQTPAGERILRARSSEAQIKHAIAYVFGGARGRRWDAVDWHELERLDAALQPYYEAPEGEAGTPGVYWTPVAGSASVEDLDAMRPEQREQLAEWEASEEVRISLADLREAYERTRECVPPSRRAIVERRIAEWERWARDPKKIPEYACEPDERTGGYTCNYPSVAGELRELRRACERDYDPDWAEPEGRAGEPGFPDLSRGPEDPRVEAPSSAEPVEDLEVQRLRQLADDGRAYGGRDAAIVERVELGGVLYQLEWRTCGKRNRVTGAAWCHCFADFPHGGHGPYWYAYWRDERSGRRRSEYVGKEFRER